MGQSFAMCDRAGVWGRGGVRWLSPALTLAALCRLRAACGVVVQANSWMSGAGVNAEQAFAA
jgi:hypothetical protein